MLQRASRVVVPVIVAALAGAVLPAARAQVPIAASEAAEATGATKLTIEQVTTMVLAARPGATIERVRLAVSGEGPHWSVGVLEGNDYTVVRMSPGDGAVYRTDKQKPPAGIDLLRSGKGGEGIGHVEAARLAAEHLGGATPFDVRVSGSTVGIVYDVWALVGDTVQWARLDADGNVLRSGDPPQPKAK